MLKQLDRKFLILAGIIIFLPIFMIILLAILQSCQNRGTNYNNYETKMKDAAEKYFTSNKLIPNDEAEISTVSLSTLVSNGYIKSSDKALNDSTCSGEVTVRRNGSSIEKNNGGFLNYIVNLKCKNYETKTIGSELKKNLKNSDSGLYAIDNEYVFKGKNLKNYINFYGKDYRIMGITSSGLIKLIRSEPETISRMWDNKYNSDVQHTYGKNIYSDSLLLQNMLEDYSNNRKISSKAKEHVVADNACIGKRIKDQVNIDKSIDCQEVIEKQVISIMTVSDYALASTDPDCNSVVSKSCNNYNYLYSIASTTWTSNASSENTYEVFYIADGIVDIQNANKYNEYNTIIYIDENEKIESGKGLSEDPYIIK